MQRIPTVLAAALLAIGTWAHAAAPDTEAVEFYNQGTGHYFVTASATEALGIDAGAAGPGWVRTGRSFQAWLSKSTAPADAQPVCRFYSPGANSHFYTASAGECLQLQGLAAAQRSATGTVKGWGYEGTAFYIQVPSGGTCPAGTTPITRVYNNGFASGEGANHRFVDDAALQDLMVDRQWIAEGTAFCAAKKATGGEANLAATASSFDAIAGSWSGSARWKTESATAETSATHDLTLTFAADGTLTGSGNGCSFSGQVTIGDGFRSFFRGTASATGCADSAFNGDYPKLRLERFGANTLMARLQRGDDTNEVSIEARLTNGSAPTPPAPGFDSVAGDWSGTVAWVATQHLSTGNIVERVSANKPLSLSISATGTVTGSGFGCTVTGTLSAAQAGDEHVGFGGDITLAGCEQPLFDGEITQVHVARAGTSRVVVSLEHEMHDAQGSTSVEIAGLLQSGSSTTPPPPAPATDALVTGAWTGSVHFLAVSKGAKDDQGTTLVSSMETLSFSIGDDGAFSGTGFGCAFTGTVAVAFGARAATGGSIAASGCTKDVFDGTYTHVRFERDDEGRLEVELERQTSDSSGKIEVRIGGTVARAAS
jgi:hypothetical protein